MSRMLYSLVGTRDVVMWVEFDGLESETGFETFDSLRSRLFLPLF